MSPDFSHWRWWNVLKGKNERFDSVCCLNLHEWTPSLQFTNKHTRDSLRSIWQQSLSRNPLIFPFSGPQIADRIRNTGDRLFVHTTLIEITRHKYATSRITNSNSHHWPLVVRIEAVRWGRDYFGHGVRSMWWGQDTVAQLSISTASASTVLH